jgi:hypothetical protein
MAAASSYAQSPQEDMELFGAAGREENRMSSTA